MLAERVVAERESAIIARSDACRIQGYREAEYRRTGDYTGMSEAEFVTARKVVEDIIGLEDYYRIEGATVEKLYRGNPKR